MRADSDARTGPRRASALSAMLSVAMLGGAAVAPIAATAQQIEQAVEQPAEAVPDAAAPDTAEERYYDAESWRALVEGKTLTYQASFGMMGREYYVPNSNRVVFVYADGRCYEGEWSETDGVFCFAYDGLHCFQHLKRGEQIIAREMDGDEQLVTKMTDEPLSCQPDLLSRAPAFESAS